MVDLLHIEPILVIYTFHADNLFHHAILMRLHSFMEKCFVHACYQLEQFLLILCIYFWLCWIFTALLGLSPVAARRGVTLGCRVQASHCVASLAAEHWPGGAWASVLWHVGCVARRRVGAVCGIFLGQGSNPCPLSWQVILIH